MQGSRDEPAGMPLPASASMWRANLPDISQRSVNAAAKAAALASVGDKLVDSLQAQSLDLPPQAAKVRSKQQFSDYQFALYFVLVYDFVLVYFTVMVLLSNPFEGMLQPGMQMHTRP